MEMYRQYLGATSLHQEIESVWLGTLRILDHVSESDLRAKLQGHRFVSTRRHGKYLLVELDDGNWLVMHFGMTGGLKYFRDLAEEPRYDRLLIGFSGGYHLAYTSQRKLGKIGVVGSPGALKESKNLGPDALDPGFDFGTFQEALSGRRGMAKSTLMNQKVIAGGGNVMVLNGLEVVPSIMSLR